MTIRAALVFGVVMSIAAGHPALPGQAAGSPAAGPAPAVEGKMDKVGKAFQFDYGAMVIGVRYLSDHRLAWEQIRGPDAGVKGEETYEFEVIRPGVYFIWWQEKDASVVTQVVDFEKGRVYTTWTSPEQKVASFQGAVTAWES